jgi:hypothetical protein
MLSALRLAVATWYSSGWKQWWLCLSSSSTLYGLPFEALDQLQPAKPPPTTTTSGNSGFLLVGFARPRWTWGGEDRPNPHRFP